MPRRFNCRRHDENESKLTQILGRNLCSTINSRAAADDAATSRRLGLLDWGRRFLPHYFCSSASALHLRLETAFAACDERRGLKLNVVGPRGGAKSTVGTLAWVLRSAVERREPYVWIVSDTKAQAENHLENIRAELLDNAELAATYPQAVGRGSLWRRHVLQLRNGPVIESLGTGQHMRGRRIREHRPTLIVCDDLQNDSHIESAAQRERSSRWFHGTLLKAGSLQTNVVNLATALHRDALAMELHRTPGWDSQIFSAVIRWPDETSLWERWEAIYCDWERTDSRGDALRFYEANRACMDAGAELLWPEVESLYALMCMRVESGRASFEREKQGSPLNPELCEWPESYFADDVWFDAWPKSPVVKVLVLDPSKGRDARHGDYSAFVLLAVDAEGRMHVEADLARRPTPQIVADGIQLYRRFRPHAFGMETNYFQELLGDEFVREFRRAGLADVVPWTLENYAAKHVRIRRLGPLLSQRRLLFRSGSSGTRLLLNQLKDFPCGDHDDGPDALEMAVRLASELTEEIQGAGGSGMSLRLAQQRTTNLES